MIATQKSEIGDRDSRIRALSKTLSHLQPLPKSWLRRRKWVCGNDALNRLSIHSRRLSTRTYWTTESDKSLTDGADYFQGRLAIESLIDDGIESSIGRRRLNIKTKISPRSAQDLNWKIHVKPPKISKDEEFRVKAIPEKVQVYNPRALRR